MFNWRPRVRDTKTQSLIHMLVQRLYKHDEYSVISKCVCSHLISPISGCFSFCFSSRSVRYWPTRSAFPWRSSFTITSSTARPMAHDTGLPPNWEIQNPHTEERLHRGWVHTPPRRSAADHQDDRRIRSTEYIADTHCYTASGEKTNNCLKHTQRFSIWREVSKLLLTAWKSI